MSKKNSFKEKIIQSHIDNTIIDKIPKNIFNIDIEKIVVQDQIRKKFTDEEINDLADSIKQYGLLNPITVRYEKGSGKYTLIAGERRLRACKLLGNKTITAHIIDIDEEERIIVQLEENIKRVDLTNYERMMAYYNILSSYMSKIVEKDVSIDNLLSELSKNEFSGGIISVIMEKIGKAPITVYKILYPLKFKIDHKLFLGDYNISYTIFEHFSGLENETTFLERVLADYAESKISKRHLISLVEKYKKEKIEKAKDRTIKTIRITSKIDDFSSLIDKIISKEIYLKDKKENIRQKIEILKEKITSLEKML